MRSTHSVPNPPQLAPVSESGATLPAAPCLNCGATTGGAYCSACGQAHIDLSASTWHVLREALSDATDVDGRVLRTVQALRSPGRLTLEFLRGKRAPYVGPLKLFLFVGAALSATWALTRGVDARYYGFVIGQSASAYIATVVRGLLFASVGVAFVSWVLCGGRRRLIDEAVFALHLVTAIAAEAALTIWLATAWKFAWATDARVPPGVPSLIYLLFLPAGVIGLLYTTSAVRRVHGVAWWAAGARALVFMGVGIAAVSIALLAPWR